MGVYILRHKDAWKLCDFPVPKCLKYNWLHIIYYISKIWNIPKKCADFLFLAYLTLNEKGQEYYKWWNGKNVWVNASVMCYSQQDPEQWVDKIWNPPIKQTKWSHDKSEHES